MIRIAGVIVASVWATSAFAQAPGAMPGPTAAPPARTGLVGKGVKASLNAASHSYSEDQPDINIERRLAFSFGGFAVIALGPTLSMQLEGMYATRGARITIDGFDAQVDYRFSYLDAVALGRYDIQTAGNLAPFLFGGGAFGLLLSAEAELSGSDIMEETMDIEDGTAGTEIALVVGAGADFRQPGGGGFTMDARYMHGLTNVADSDDPDAVEVYSRVFSLFVGYGF